MRLNDLRTLVLVFGAFALATSATAAEAHTRHRHKGKSHVGIASRVTATTRNDTEDRGAFNLFGLRIGVWNSAGLGNSLVSEARSQIGNGAVYGRPTLWCARFVNWVLSKTGHRGTGSDAAASFAHYGHVVPGPQVGAIAVMSRRGGGHVGIVSGVTAEGNPVIISGNHNRRVRETVYPRGRVYAYVAPAA